MQDLRRMVFYRRTGYFPLLEELGKDMYQLNKRTVGGNLQLVDFN